MTLDVGDAVTFNSDVAHSYANPGVQPARFTLAVFEPGVGAHRGRSLAMPDVDPCRPSSTGARVDSAMFALRPDYRALLVAVDGIVPGPSDSTSEDADCRRPRPRHGRALRTTRWSSCLTWRRGAMHTAPSGPSRSAPVTAWRRSRAGTAGLPRVNRLTDIYNAVSVLHQLPLGGEDLTRYTGSPRLAPRDRRGAVRHHRRRRSGRSSIPDPGEVVWRDDPGVTCRRWNWRQVAPHPAHATRPPRRCSSSTPWTR